MGWMVEVVPFLAVERIAMMDFPPLAWLAPMAKSAAPPVPVYWMGTHALRTDLTHHVHLDGGVDRDHVVVLRDDIGVVGVGAPHEPDGGVLVDKVVQFLGAQGKVPDDFPRWRVFFLPLTTPASANLAMLLVIISVWIPRSFFSMKYRAAALGMLPIPSWICGSVGHQVGYVFADLHIHLTGAPSSKATMGSLLS